MTCSGSTVRTWRFSKNEEGRNRPAVIVAVATLLAVSIVPSVGVVMAQAQSAPAAARPAAAKPAAPAPGPSCVVLSPPCFALSSGQTTDTTGHDPNTSFCFQPASPEPTETGVGPASPTNPRTIATDPRKPTCNTTAGVPTSPFVLAAQPPPGHGTISGAKWIGPQVDGGDSLLGTSPPQWYVYDRKFKLSCPAGSLTGSAYSDNVVGVFLNGHLLASQQDRGGGSLDTNNFGANGTGPLLYNTTSFFNAGLNEVDFVVYDTTGNSTGLDYSFTVTPTKGPCGTLKICKVAGPGVPIGTSFKFTITDPSPPSPSPRTVFVPAGPAPGGYCQIAGSTYLVGSTATIKETIPSIPATQVTSISANAPTTGLNLSTGQVSVTIATTGVTVATYTDARKGKKSYLEICEGGLLVGPGGFGTFSYTVSSLVPAQTFTVLVPLNGCSPPIQMLASSSVTVTGSGNLGFSTLPADRLIACSFGPPTATIIVTSPPNDTILNVSDTDAGGSPTFCG